jgi:peptidoglycan glycosyltransferase
MIFLITKFSTNAEKWAFKPYNLHLSLNSFADAGRIYDTNSTVLAESIDGKRIYNEDSQIRKAVFHLVGDESFNISTSIQNKFRDKLFGYNFLSGIDLPSFLRKKSDVYLNVDSKLCKLALSELKDHKGAVALYNYKTGEVLCMVSTPTLDIKNLPNDISSNKNKDYDAVFLNKILSANFVPGSIFKLVTAICTFENIPKEALEKTFECKGKEIVENEKITCAGYHGKIGLKEGLKESCNIVLGNFAMTLGKNNMIRTAEKLCFNKPIKTDIGETKESYFNLSDANKASVAWSGIGQYKNLVNPLHMLTIVGAIANEGVAVMPKIIKENKNNFLNHRKSKNSEENCIRYTTKDVANKVKEMMSYTAKSSIFYKFHNFNTCLKTGTAEVGGEKKPHAWVTGFLQNEKHPVAFIVLVENAGSGFEEAVPIAAKLLKEVTKET